MKSSVVIISWWSNSLALYCIAQLRKFCNNRAVYVVQCGKTPRQKKVFSGFLDEDIIELPYPEEAPAEHYCVIEHVIQQSLPDEEGLWFLDHDAFLLEDADNFFDRIDNSVEQAQTCMFTPAQLPFTIPTFWISPQRIPRDCPGLAPYPNKISEASRRPDMFEKKENLITPQYDTLELAQQFLARRNLAVPIPLSFFPEHQHLGGLHVLLRSAIKLKEQASLDERFNRYMAARVKALRDFFSTCPQGWLTPEEDEIIEKLDAVISFTPE